PAVVPVAEPPRRGLREVAGDERLIGGLFRLGRRSEQRDACGHQSSRNDRCARTPSSFSFHCIPPECKAAAFLVRKSVSPPQLPSKVMVQPSKAGKKRLRAEIERPSGCQAPLAATLPRPMVFDSG